MTRTEANKRIAKVLGFRIHDPGEGYIPTWIYPNKYYHLQAVSPALNIPDFVGMIDKYIELSKTDRITKDWHSEPRRSDKTFMEGSYDTGTS